MGGLRQDKQFLMVAMSPVVDDSSWSTDTQSPGLVIVLDGLPGEFRVLLRYGLLVALPKRQLVQSGTLQSRNTLGNIPILAMILIFLGYM